MAFFKKIKALEKQNTDLMVDVIKLRAEKTELINKNDELRRTVANLTLENGELAKKAEERSDAERLYADHLIYLNNRLTEDNKKQEDKILEIENKYIELEEAFTALESSAKRAADKRDKFGEKICQNKTELAELKADRDMFFDISTFFVCLYNKIINGFSNDKRILIKHNDLDKVVKEAEEATGVDLNEVIQGLEARFNVSIEEVEE